MVLIKWMVKYPNLPVERGKGCYIRALSNKPKGFNADFDYAKDG